MSAIYHFWSAIYKFQKNASAIYHLGRLYTTLGPLWLNIEKMSAIYHCKSAIYHSENLGRLYTIFDRPFSANFVSTRCLFWGLFRCCELSFYTRCLFWGLFTCCELSFYTRCLFWGVFTCCELCSYTMSILANKPVNVFGKYVSCQIKSGSVIPICPLSLCRLCYSFLVILSLIAFDFIIIVLRFLQQSL